MSGRRRPVSWWFPRPAPVTPGRPATGAGTAARTCGSRANGCANNAASTGSPPIGKKVAAVTGTSNQATGSAEPAPASRPIRRSLILSPHNMSIPFPGRQPGCRSARAAMRRISQFSLLGEAFRRLTTLLKEGTGFSANNRTAGGFDVALLCQQRSACRTATTRCTRWAAPACRSTSAIWAISRIPPRP